MAVQLITHPACLEHEMGEGHPERPERLRAVLEALSAPEFDALDRREAPLADIAAIHRVHPPEYVHDVLDSVPKQGYCRLDMDTVLNPASGEAALRAAGAVIAGVDAVMEGWAESAFCAVRPPGHHAEPTQAMGFCLFNNVAVGAQHAHHTYGLKRIAIIDFDVHHGNGTQAAFVTDDRFLFASTHQIPLYPGTGRRGERGKGNILNVPLAPGAGSDEFRHAFNEEILPRILDFDPQIIFVSAGFDAHRDDPLAHVMLETADYTWVTREILRIADMCCDGKVVSTLEGGYDLGSLAASSAAHVRALMRH